MSVLQKKKKKKHKKKKTKLVICKDSRSNTIYTTNKNVTSIAARLVAQW